MYLKIIDESLDELVNYYDSPFYVFLSLSNLCNANCKFCDVKTNKEFKSTIDIYKLIDELVELGTKYIHFTGGGEPFANDDIFKYLEYCTKKDLKIIFISNGYNIDEEKIIQMSKYNIHAVFFSIDSFDSKIHDNIRGVKGIWERVTNNINLIKKYMPNVKINLNHVLNKTNIDDFSKFLKLKETYDFDFVNPLVVKDCEELFPTNEQIKKYNSNLKEYYNLAQKLHIDFLSDNIDFFNTDVTKLGDRYEFSNLKCVCPSYIAFIDAPSAGVYPCDCSLHRDRNIYKIGDLHENNFKKIWNNSKRNNLKEMLLDCKLECRKKCDNTNCFFNKQLLRRLQK